MKVSLRPGERIFVNGAVLRVDRKVSLEFLNDVTFLLESHVMQPEMTTTPLRQLYFIIQNMWIDPRSAAVSRELFDRTFPLLIATFETRAVLDGLRDVAALVAEDKIYDALRSLRPLFAVEDDILAGRQPSRKPEHAHSDQKREVA